jgi:hypothetical protein
MALQPSVNAVVLSTARAFAYDEQYPDPQTTSLVVGPIGTANADTGAARQAVAILGGPCGKQIRSITVTPLVAPTAGDNLSLTLQSYAAQVFGTATATAVTVGNGTNLGTGINKVQFCIFTSVNGTSSYVGPTGTQFVGFGTQVAYNPTFIPLVGGTCTVIVTAPAGTNTQGNYVFPAGPAGGLTVGPNDTLVIAKGTDTVSQYAIDIEWTYTTGGNFSR